jgi:putative SbcD/Mre11-related phosphoesterase
MEILKGIKIHDLALFIQKGKVLILCDQHIGQEEAMNKEGILIPRFQHKDLIAKTKKIILETKPDIIILNGDIKHEFSGISRDEWKKVQEYIDLLVKHAKVIIIKGNHDNILEPIASKKGIILADYYNLNNIFICHGDKIPKNEDFKKSKVIIIGHEHPSIGLSQGNRVEKYKCFLKGKYEDKTLIVMPSMNQLTEGSDMLSERLLSPFLRKTKENKTMNIDNFETWIVEKEEVFYFGKIKGLRNKI